MNQTNEKQEKIKASKKAHDDKRKEQPAIPRTRTNTETINQLEQLANHFGSKKEALEKAIYTLHKNIFE